jgi:hypothetical protein
MDMIIPLIKIMDGSSNLSIPLFPWRTEQKNITYILGSENEVGL